MPLKLRKIASTAVLLYRTGGQYVQKGWRIQTLIRLLLLLL
jgi:hypothetical protein